MGVIRKQRDKFFKYLMSRQTVLKYVLKNLPEEFVGVQLKYDDHQLMVNPKTSFGLETARRGLFHRVKIKAIQDLIPAKNRTGTVLELGSNVGTETVSLLLEGYQHIICVEPDPSHIQSLNRNIDINEFAARTTIINSAVGDVEGTGQLNRNPENPSANSFIWDASADTSSTLEVPIQPIDSILALAGTDPAQINFVWMDVEGYELKAFGSMHTLAKAKTPVFFEYTGGIVNGKRVHAAADIETFIAFAAAHYDQCYVMELVGNTFKPLAIADISKIDRQVDILLF